TSPPDIYTISLHDALPIWYGLKFSSKDQFLYASGGNDNRILKYSTANNKLKLVDSVVLGLPWPTKIDPAGFDIDEARQLLYVVRSEEHTSELQSLAYLVCR